MSNSRSIVVGIGALFIIPLVISIAMIIHSDISEKNRLGSALETTVDDEIASAISDQNDIDLNNNVLHEISRDGEYVAVDILSTEASRFGDSATVILVKKSDGYDTVYIGTGYGPDDLIEQGVPSSFANKLTSDDEDSYSETIGNSPLNPRNKYPIVRNLPFVTDDLTIDYYFKDNIKDSDGVNIPVILISGVDAAERINAFNKIRNLGYDLGTYPVVFGNFNNPFLTAKSDWESAIAEDDLGKSTSTEDPLTNGDDEEGP